MQIQRSLKDLFEKKMRPESDDEEVSAEVNAEQVRKRTERKTRMEEEDMAIELELKKKREDVEQSKKKRSHKKKINKAEHVVLAAASPTHTHVNKTTAVQNCAIDMLLQMVGNTVAFACTTWDEMHQLQRETACLEALKRYRTLPSSHSSPVPPDLESLVASANAFLTGVSVRVPCLW